jgi:hypothetical protein
MVDYAKLAEEEKARLDAANAAAEAEQKLKKAVLDFFSSIETHLGEETAKANEELGKRGDPVFSAPQRSNEQTIELAYGARNPCCKLTLQAAEAEVGLTRILVELLDDSGKTAAQSDYVLEEKGPELKVYKSLVEGFPDHDAEISSAEIAQEIVPGIIRGHFE